MVACDENGLPASTRNITRACRSVVPLLDTCMALSAPWPAAACPACTRIVPCSPRMLCSPVSTKNASDPGWLCADVTLPGGPLASLIRSRYCVALMRGIGPTSAIFVPFAVELPGEPSVNNHTFPADSAASDQGPAAAVASASESKFSIRQNSSPGGSSATFLSAKGLITSACCAKAHEAAPQTASP